MSSTPTEPIFTSPQPTPPIPTTSGLISGLLHQPPNTITPIRSFLGIPYASPPLGPLRWRPPQPPLPWTGVRSATKYGKSCVQNAPPGGSLYSGGENGGEGEGGMGVKGFSEDCLYLNVWTGPAVDEGGGEGKKKGEKGEKVGNGKKRPVLVYFHMGAFVFGSASNPLYNGATLASRGGVTVVTVNYRLGRFGFLACPDLSAESSHHHTHNQPHSGNYGILDQIAALQWVQRNISSFNGSPSNVTIGGASAGGASVHILRSSPLASGLFHKAIIESGPGLTPTVPNNGPGHLARYTTLSAAEQAGMELMDVLRAETIEEMRQVPAEDILKARLKRGEGVWRSSFSPSVGTGTSLCVFDGGNPIVDGVVLPTTPLEALLGGEVADVPLLVGNVGDEGNALPHLTSLVDYHTFAKEEFGNFADEVLALYPAQSDKEAKAATTELLADQVFVYPTWTCARLQATSGRMKAPVWYYRFKREPPIPRDSPIVADGQLGAFHGAGVPYVFGSLDAWKQWDWTEADKKLSRDMMDAWVRFIRDGDPNEGEEGDDVWPALDSGAGLMKIWDCEVRVERPQERLKEITAFWDRYYGIDGENAV